MPLVGVGCDGTARVTSLGEDWAKVGESFGTCLLPFFTTLRGICFIASLVSVLLDRCD